MSNRVFFVEDNVDDSMWLIDLLEYRGYTVDVEANEIDARRRLDRVRAGELSYALAIFDIMVPTMDFIDIVELDDSFYSTSKDTGLRLCSYARKVLGLSSEQLPIVCLSAREDETEVKEELTEVDVRLFSRISHGDEEDIRSYIHSTLPDLSGHQKTPRPDEG